MNASTARPTAECVWVRLARWAGGALVLLLRIVVVGLAMGVAPPSRVAKPLRHDDAVVQVEEEEMR